MLDVLTLCFIFTFCFHITKTAADVDTDDARKLKYLQAVFSAFVMSDWEKKWREFIISPHLLLPRFCHLITPDEALVGRLTKGHDARKYA